MPHRRSTAAARDVRKFAGARHDIRRREHAGANPRGGAARRVRGGSLGCAPGALAHAQLRHHVAAVGRDAWRAQPARGGLRVQRGGRRLARRRSAFMTRSGAEVDDLHVEHPHGSSHSLAVGLKAHLPGGTYTATYRVISADTHIVYGGLCSTSAMPRSRRSDRRGADRPRREPRHEGRFWRRAVARLLSIALFVGGLAFLFVAWGPGLELAGPSEPPGCGGASFAGRHLAGAGGGGRTRPDRQRPGGVAAGRERGRCIAMGLAERRGTSKNTLESRFGAVWAARARSGWCSAGRSSLRGRSARRSCRVRADGRRRPSPPLRRAGWSRCWGSPARTSRSRRRLRVTRASRARGGSSSRRRAARARGKRRVGGIVCLLFAFPRRPGARGADRAGSCCGALAVLAAGARRGGRDRDHRRDPGVHRRAQPERAADSTYGRWCSPSPALLLGLIALGWVNRERLMPALRRIAELAARRATRECSHGGRCAPSWR